MRYLDDRDVAAQIGAREPAFGAIRRTGVRRGVCAAVLCARARRETPIRCALATGTLTRRTADMAVFGCRLGIDGRHASPWVRARQVSPIEVRADERRSRRVSRVKGNGVSSIVLVHGGLVDGSGWEGVYQILRKSGHAVTVVQNPTTSLVDDVAVTKRALDQQPGQAVLVGHSYGGVVITTEAGNHPKVAALVYIAAFAPDGGKR